MKIHFECIPCFFRQALNVLDNLKVDDNIKEKVLREIAGEVKNIDFNQSPPVFSYKVYRIISQKTGNEDPFKEIKEKTNKLALEIWDFIKEIYSKAKNKLETAIKIAIAGNIIDFGAIPDLSINSKEKLKKELVETLKQTFWLKDLKAFEKDLKKSRTILYIGDNSGEIVFDKILLKYLKEQHKEIFYAVRGKPIINDITYEDALKTGIGEYATIVNSGSPIAGCKIDLCNENFKKLFYEADMVIAKGQGNFETLENEKRSMYFLLKVKCKPVAKYLKRKVGDIVFIKYH